MHAMPNDNVTTLDNSLLTNYKKLSRSHWLNNQRERKMKIHFMMNQRRRRNKNKEMNKRVFFLIGCVSFFFIFIFNYTFFFIFNKFFFAHIFFFLPLTCARVTSIYEGSLPNSFAEEGACERCATLN